MIRRLVAGLIVIGLAVGVWALWPRDDPDPDPSTLPVAEASTTSTTAPSSTTTTAAPTTTTTSAESHVVTSVEEAEEILRSLWFGWFEGIYNQDEDRIREVVGTEEQLQAAVSQFGQMAFSEPPSLQGVTLGDIEILRSDVECLSVWSVTSATFRPGQTEGVSVLRRRGDSWVFVGSWIYREDLWESDCESELEPLPS